MTDDCKYITINYDINEIFKYKEYYQKPYDCLANYQLRNYGNSYNRAGLLNRYVDIDSNIVNEMEKVARNIKDQKDPNDAQFNRVLNDIFNKLSAKNYDTYLNKLKSFKLYSQTQVSLLARELFQRIITDSYVSGPYRPALNDKTLSDLLTNIIVELADSFEVYNFTSTLISLEEKHFEKVINNSMNLNIHNTDMINKYYAHMNFL